MNAEKQCSRKVNIGGSVITDVIRITSKKLSELKLTEARHVSMFELCSRTFPIVIFQLLVTSGYDDRGTRRALHALDSLSLYSNSSNEQYRDKPSHI